MMTSCGNGRSGAAGGPARHIPVLLSEVMDALRPRDGGVYIDGTFGAGGYTRAILDTADCVVLAIDRDPDAIADGASLAADRPGRLKLVEGSFGKMGAIAAAEGITTADGVAFDVGVSSMQLESVERGFSFQLDGPLDMRMSRTGPSAADVVNAMPERDLTRVIGVLGEERRARAIARAIADRRALRPIARTRELADIVIGVLGHPRGVARHPATRTFQALRIFVNAELDELVRGLLAAERLLIEGGRLVVVTFHSLEDRIVKRFFSSRSGKRTRPSRHLPEGEGVQRAPSFRLVHRKPVSPGADEIGRNPRARSARLRAGERTAAAPFPPDVAELGLPRLDMALP